MASPLHLLVLSCLVSSHLIYHTKHSLRCSYLSPFLPVTQCSKKTQQTNKQQKAKTQLQLFLRSSLKGLPSSLHVHSCHGGQLPANICLLPCSLTSPYCFCCLHRGGFKSSPGCILFLLVLYQHVSPLEGYVSFNGDSL